MNVEPLIIKIPGDKSITHRVLFMSLFYKYSQINNFCNSQDCLATIDCLKKLGVAISMHDLTIKTKLINYDRNFDDIKLDAQNSGTTARLITGIISGWNGSDFILTGDMSLSNRPMSRLIEPLRLMGADITDINNNSKLPILIKGRKLTGIKYSIPTASAQIQSALLFAGLSADNYTITRVPKVVRNHTQKLFRSLNIYCKNIGLLTSGTKRINSIQNSFMYDVPSDLSSASFFMVLASLFQDANIITENVNINLGRKLIIDVMQTINCDLNIYNHKTINFEDIYDINIKSSKSYGDVVIDANNIATGIDEIMIIALLLALNNGTSIIKDARELMYKESNRLSLIIKNLANAGANIQPINDGFKIIGIKELYGDSVWITDNDHRIAMTGVIANLIAKKNIKVDNTNCIAISFLDFLNQIDLFKRKFVNKL